MGSVDIANAKPEGDRSFRDTAGDVLFSVLVMAGNYKDRIMRPFREGVPVPRLRRAASVAGQVVGQAVNRVDVALGDRRPGPMIGTWLTVHSRAASVGDQLLASVGATADAEAGGHSLVVNTVSVPVEPVRVYTGLDGLGARESICESLPLDPDWRAASATDSLPVVDFVGEPAVSPPDYPYVGLDAMGRRDGHL